jgi:hypothetical protein
MSEQNETEQNQSELTEETLENVAGGVNEYSDFIPLGPPPIFPTHD